MPFSCPFFGALESCSNSPKTGSKSLFATRLLPFPEGVYTSAHRCKHGAFRIGALLLPSDCFTRFGTPAWSGGKTAYFAAFGSWPGVLPKNAESLRDSDALMRVAVPRRRGPAGLRNILFGLPMLYFSRSAHGDFCVCEVKAVPRPCGQYAGHLSAWRPGTCPAGPSAGCTAA